LKIAELLKLIALMTYLEACIGLQYLLSVSEGFHMLWHHIYLYAGVKKCKTAPCYLEIMKKFTS